MHVAYKEFNTTRKFGVELEIHPSVTKMDLTDRMREFEKRSVNPRQIIMEGGPEGWAESIDNNYWHVKYDSSCGPVGKKKQDGGGWEIASYVASGVRDAIHIAKAASYLEETGVQVNNHCGLHIHVDAADFTADQMGVLLGHWLKIESVVQHALPEHRKKNKYCKLLRQRMKGYDPSRKLWDHIKPKNLCPHENPDKKFTLNTVGWCAGERPTVELRWPECLLDRMHVYNWILFIVNFVDACKNREMPKNFDGVKTIDDTLELMGLQGEDEGQALILDEHLHLLKLWFLRRVSRYGTHKKLVADAQDKLVFLTKI